MVSEYDFWLLDLDGTLVDVEWSYTRGVFDRVGDRLGHEFSDREAEIIWNGLTGSRDYQLREWGIDPGAFWDAFHAEEDPLVRAEQTYLHDDAAFVADLDEPVGLVTHCQEFLCEPVLDELDIHDWFDAKLCCTEQTGWKPDPAPVEYVMNELGVGYNGHQGVLAGDGACDVGAAWNAGIDAIHVERIGHERRGRCVLGDYRVQSFDELEFPQ
ncbi:HAD family hydrolase [Natronobacterium gregoryi]|uniref:HAD family hydrolase n=2 Tax=Natronobacterium gregoryi TaxID=44930 RepID=L0AMB1_NATGS|nr:HAD family hydrolase [Natronobacterium gregoryi]AFZ74327.1 putative phosphatase [Natronobacterium gregoryi SP2]ELY63560.1 haloacid dehalogenase [Natronobacterium gregoryi SP2]PLK22163.1 HAD family hydrolase [Natronobacterium gregoryi SP2]SFI53799.1 phosphoglycolate phosphatase [Natronobacterium gregoryi]